MMITLRLNDKPASLAVHELGAIRMLLDSTLTEKYPPEVMDQIYFARQSVSEAMRILGGVTAVTH